MYCGAIGENKFAFFIILGNNVCTNSGCIVINYVSLGCHERSLPLVGFFYILHETTKTIMEKIFDKWNQIKKIINAQETKIFFHERDIWFAHFGKNVGHEQDGGSEFLRPVVILKKFNQRVFWGIPLTMKSKKGEFYFTIVDKQNGKVRVAILSQLRLLDVNRLKTKIGSVSQDEFGGIKKAIQRWLD